MNLRLFYLRGPFLACSDAKVCFDDLKMCCDERLRSD